MPLLRQLIYYITVSYTHLFQRLSDPHLAAQLSLVREDRDGRTSGAPVVTPVAQLGSYVRNG